MFRNFSVSVFTDSQSSVLISSSSLEAQTVFDYDILRHLSCKRSVDRSYATQVRLNIGEYATLDARHRLVFYLSCATFKA